MFGQVVLGLEWEEVVRRFTMNIIGGMLAAIPTLCASAWFGPSNSDECITDSMRGVTSDVAARAIIRSCRARFPEKVVGPASIDLPRDALAKLTGRAGVDSINYFSGTIYNGNNDYTITQITISLTPKKRAINSLGTKEYNSDALFIVPLSNSPFSISVDTGGEKDFEWNIARARGHKSK